MWAVAHGVAVVEVLLEAAANVRAMSPAFPSWSPPRNAAGWPRRLNYTVLRGGIHGVAFAPAVR